MSHPSFPSSHKHQRRAADRSQVRSAPGTSPRLSFVSYATRWRFDLPARRLITLLLLLVATAPRRDAMRNGGLSIRNITQRLRMVSRFVCEVNVERGLSEHAHTWSAGYGQQCERQKLLGLRWFFDPTLIWVFTRPGANPEGSTPDPVNCVYEKCPALCGRFPELQWNRCLCPKTIGTGFAPGVRSRSAVSR